MRREETTERKASRAGSGSASAELPVQELWRLGGAVIFGDSKNLLCEKFTEESNRNRSLAANGVRNAD